MELSRTQFNLLDLKCFSWHLIWYGVCFADIDECIVSSPGCDHECVNIDGSFYCSCLSGYMLQQNGTNCSGNAHVQNIHLFSAFILDTYFTYIMYIVTKIELDLEIWIQWLNGNDSNKVMFIWGHYTTSMLAQKNVWNYTASSWLQI